MTLDREHLELTVPEDDRVPVVSEAESIRFALDAVEANRRRRRHRGCGVSVIPWLVLAVVVWGVGL